jgi:hypothetical protein
LQRLISLLQRLSLHLIYEIEGALLTLFEYPTNVFSKDAKNCELDTAEKKDRGHD